MNLIARLQSVFFDLVLEGAAADAKEFGCLGTILVRFTQGIDDHLFFSHMGDGLYFFLEGGRRIGLSGGFGLSDRLILTDVRPEGIQGELFGFTACYRVENHGFEFSDISRERIG